MVLNVLASFASSTSDERAAGFAWYDTAYRWAAGLGRIYNVPVNIAVAVVAALSPQVEWEANKRWAVKVIKAHAFNRPLPLMGLGNSLARAERALSGDLSDIHREEGTFKVNRFYRSIMGEGGVACIDRHAIRVAIGDYLIDEVPPLSKGRYLAIEEAYVDAARELRKGARHIQAVTWLVAKRERDLVNV